LEGLSLSEAGRLSDDEREMATIVVFLLLKAGPSTDSLSSSEAMTTTRLFFSKGASGGKALSVAKGIAAIGVGEVGASVVCGEVGSGTMCGEAGLGVVCGEVGVGVAWAEGARGVVEQSGRAGCAKVPALLVVALSRTDKTPASI